MCSALMDLEGISDIIFVAELSEGGSDVCGIHDARFVSTDALRMRFGDKSGNIAAYASLAERRGAIGVRLDADACQQAPRQEPR